MSDIIERWLDKQLYPDEMASTRYLKDRRIKIICRRGVIYSCDRRFPLAICLYHRNKFSHLLLNGDMGTRTNTRHQQELRDIVFERIPSPPIIVPFSALDAASIDKTTIRPIEITEDRIITIEHRVAPWKKEDIIWRNESYYYANGYCWESGFIQGRDDLRFRRQLVRYVDGREEEKYFEAYSRRTGSLVRTRGKEQYWFEERHRLGDSVFRAKVNGRYRTFVSSFDYQEPAPLYFLAEVPQGALVKSVDDAIVALSPPIVHAAVAQGRDVKRQGDMFAIPTSLTTEDVLARTTGGIQRGQGVFGTDHVVSEVAIGKKRSTYARGTMHHKPEGRRRDHEPCSLGKIWHLMVPNAVPRRRRGMQMRARRA